MSEAPRLWRASPAARWLPWTLAAAIVVAGAIVALSIDPESAFATSPVLRLVIWIAAATIALWILRRGAELGDTVSVDTRGVVVARGAHRREIGWAAVAGIDYAAPFADSRTWVPATVLRLEGSSTQRLSALLDDGAALIRTMVAASGRTDLAAWVEARGIDRRMQRAGARVAIGYAVALLVVVAAIGLRVR